jgi:hypothetical protein
MFIFPICHGPTILKIFSYNALVSICLFYPFFHYFTREPEEPNFTGPESRIMKAGNGQHFEQSYNAQAAVDTEGSMLILGS